MIKVFVVILNWNRADLTIDCLRSVSKLHNADYDLQIVVVDNASSDNSVEKIQNSLVNNSAYISKLKILINEENLGFAGGNNIGLKFALRKGADFVMVLNNDTRVHPDLVDGFLSVAENYPKFGAASPKIYFEKGFEFHKGKYKNTDLGKVIWYAGGKIDWNNVYGETRGVDESDAGQYDQLEDTDFATGTCMFISRDALKDVGLFNEKYFMYYEDTDLSVRMIRKGFSVLYVPQSIVWHKVAQSSAIGSDLNDYFITRNRLMFGMHYANLRTRFALYRESLRHLLNGRTWQRKGVLDFYLGRLGKGSWK